MESDTEWEEADTECGDVSEVGGEDDDDDVMNDASDDNDDDDCRLAACERRWSRGRIA